MVSINIDGFAEFSLAYEKAASPSSFER